MASFDLVHLVLETATWSSCGPVVGRLSESWGFDPHPPVVYQMSLDIILNPLLQYFSVLIIILGLKMLQSDVMFRCCGLDFVFVLHKLHFHSD